MERLWECLVVAPFLIHIPMQGLEEFNLSHGAAERSAAAGYELSPEVQQFLNMTAPELGGGPGNFDINSPFPWQNPGRIGEADGGILQHHALMPNNLRYNQDTQVWDVPTERRFPGGTGIWGGRR